MKRAQSNDAIVIAERIATAHRMVMARRIVLALAMLALLGTAAPAQAQATITVNSTAQEATTANPNGIVNGNCTLGEAILAANNNAAVDGCVTGQSGGFDTVIIPAGTYTLTTVWGTCAGPPVTLGLPPTAANIILQGAGAATTIIERSSAPGTPDFSLFCADGPSFELRGLTFRNARGTSGGPFGAHGGAVQSYNNGANLIVDSIFENNFTDSMGGAIFLYVSSLTVRNSFFTGNTAPNNGGGAIASGTFSSLSIIDSTFVGNTALYSGALAGTTLPFGGGTGPINISGSLFVNNSAGAPGSGAGGVIGAMQGGATITNSIFDGNSDRSGCGGAISNCSPPAGLTITGSLFVNNIAFGDSSGNQGAGAVGSPTATVIRNTTFSGNFGGYNYSLLTGGGSLLNNVTMVGTQGLWNASGSTTYQNTIFQVPPGVPDCNSFPNTFPGGNYVDGGHNFGCAAPGGNALLGGLADNGSTVMAGANLPGVTGATPRVIQTYALLIGSPALGGGDPGPADGAGSHCEATDQRGIARPQPGGGVCDIGALEDLTGNGVPTTADYSVTKTGNPGSVPVGQNVTFTITVTNTGPDPAAATLNDALPGSFNFVSLASPAGWTCMTPAVGTSGTVNCTHAGLSAGAPQAFTLDITATSGGSIGNTASVSTPATDPNAVNDSATAMTTVTSPNADLALTKGDAPDPVILGAGNITYTLTVTNNGPGSASSVVLTDTLPGNANFVSATLSQGSCGGPAGGVLTCNLGTISNAATATVSVVVTPTATGTVNNSASVMAAEFDPNTANNSATAATTVNAQADLDANKTDAADPVLAGSNITYTLNVQNLGPSPATNVVLVDTLPASVAFVSVGAPCAHNAGIVTCNFGALAAGAFTANVSLVVTTTAASVPSVLNRSVVSGNEPDPVAINNNGDETTVVNPSADVSVTVSDAPDPVNAGANVTYTVTVSNAGPSPATAVLLTNTLPANVTLVSSVPGAGTCNAPAAGSFTCNLGTIASGGNVVVPVVVMTTGATAASITNSATASAAEFDPSAANNTNSATTTVTPVANLGVTVTDAPDPVAQGSNITYTITVTNAGPSPATGVTATAPVPANVTFVSGTATQGTCTQAAGTITCTIGTMASGATVTATIVVLTTAAGAVNASIAVASPVLDPTPANNSATATTTVNAPAAADFTIAASPASASLQGNQQSATFALTLAPTPAGSPFTSAINLTCFATPAVAVLCSATPNAVTPGSTSAASTLTVTRVVNAAPPGNSATVPSRGPSLPGGPWPALVATLALLAWLRTRWGSFAGIPLLPAHRLGARARVAAALLLALGALLTQAGCRSDSPPAFRGSVAVTVTGTSGATSHSTTVTINVQ